MQQIQVQVDGVHYLADAAVVKRMQEYYDTMTNALKAYNKLSLQVEKVRRLQKQYYASRAPDVLRASKAAERELDDIIEPRAKKQAKKQQNELFR